MELLETKRFQLRVIEDTDIANIHRGLSHPEVIKYYGVRFLTLEATKEQMQWYADLLENNTGIWWGIYTKDTREFVGAGGFNDADSTHKKAEIGFWLLPDYWGQGIMKEVMPAIFSYGFDVMGLNRIEGFVDHENEKCKKALQKINFQYEGTMRESEVENGRFIDVDIFARLRKDAES